MRGRDGKAATRIPLDGGHVEVTLPAAVLRADPKARTVVRVDIYH